MGQKLFLLLLFVILSTAKNLFPSPVFAQTNPTQCGFGETYCTAPWGTTQCWFNFICALPGASTPAPSLSPSPSPSPTSVPSPTPADIETTQNTSCGPLRKFCPDNITCIWNFQDPSDQKLCPQAGPVCNPGTRTFVPDSCKVGLTCDSANEGFGGYNVCRTDGTRSDYQEMCGVECAPPTDLELLGPDYADWVARMHRIGVYPVKDRASNKVVFLSRQKYEELVCHGHCTTDPDYDSFIAGIHNNSFQFIIALGHRLHNDCYVPFEALAPYFPDADNPNEPLEIFKRVNGQSVYPAIDGERLWQPYPNCAGQTKYVLSQQDFDRYISEAAQTYANNNQNDPFIDYFRRLQTSTHGFLPTYSMLRLFAMTDGNNPNREDILDFSSAMLGGLPFGRANSAVNQIRNHTLQLNTGINVRGLIQNIRGVRGRIQNGERVPVDDVENALGNNLHEVSLPNFPPGTYMQIRRADLTNESFLTQQFGIRVGQGEYGQVYQKNGVATKIATSKRGLDDSLDIISAQKTILEKADGMPGMPHYYGIVIDETNTIVGLRMEYIPDPTIESLVVSTGQPLNPTLGERLTLARNYANIIERTGYFHGDFGIIVNANTTRLNGGNITYGSRGYTFLDFGGPDTSITTHDIAYWLDERGFIRAFFSFGGETINRLKLIEVTDETRAIGQFLERQLTDESKTLKEALFY